MAYGKMAGVFARGASRADAHFQRIVSGVCDRALLCFKAGFDQLGQATTLHF